MAALASVLRFGRHELRPAERRLLIDGKPAPVGARAFDVLVALIERRDRVVSSNELFELVWPEAVVEENNLRQQVSALRKLLGAAAIGTIPGRGYRFTAPLDEGTEGRADPDRAGVAPANDSRQTHPRADHRDSWAVPCVGNSVRRTPDDASSQ